MIISGKNSITLLKNFNEDKALLTPHDDVESFEKAILDKAKKSFAEDRQIETDPKIEDYAYIDFRHISKTIVGSQSYKATDFSRGNVLRDSVELLNGVNAYTNHFAYVGNQIGKVLNPVWSNAFTNKKGDKVPAGIDAPFVIDKVLHPKLVRELNSLVGSPIDSASVTVVFEWEASHEFEHEYDFYYHLGEEIDNEEVRRIAGNIMYYDESSLVWSGADPYAKIKEQQRSIEAETKTRNNKFSKTPELAAYDSGRLYFVYDSKNDQRVQQFNEALSFNSQNPKTKAMDAKFKQFIADALGMSKDQVSEETLKGLKVLNAEDHTSLSAEAGKVTGLNSQIETLKQEKQSSDDKVTALEAEKANLEKDAKIGKGILSKAIEDTKSLYNKFSEGNPDDKIVAEIEKADSLELLEAKAELFGGKVYQKFGASCKKCGSQEISMRKSEPGAPPLDDNDSEDDQPLYQTFAN